MIYFRRIMKKLIRPAIIAVLSIFLLMSCAVIAFSTKAPVFNDTTGAAFLLQTTPSPPVDVDQSEVGSTDEIVIMGAVIVTIVLIPIILQRKAWAKKDQY